MNDKKINKGCSRYREQRVHVVREQTINRNDMRAGVYLRAALNQYKLYSAGLHNTQSEWHYALTGEPNILCKIKIVPMDRTRAI